MGFARGLLGYAVGAALGMGFVAGAEAAIWTETGSAIALFQGGAGPQAVGSGIDEIRGTISGGDEGDLYKITFAVGGSLDIIARDTSGNLNPSLFLFSVTGGGIRVDDNSGPLLASRLIVTIAPGTYYIGIGDDPLQAVDTDGTTWNATLVADGAPPADFGVLERLRNVAPNGIVSPGNYVITLSITTGDPPAGGGEVPEPMTLGLLGMGLLGLGAAARRRRA